MPALDLEARRNIISVVIEGIAVGLAVRARIALIPPDRGRLEGVQVGR